MIRRDSADEAAKCAASLARLIRIVDQEDYTVRRHTWPVMRSLCEEASIMLRRGEIPGEYPQSSLLSDTIVEPNNTGTRAES